MYSVEIEGLCPRSHAPLFRTYEEAKRCFDAALDFVYRTHPMERVEVWLLYGGDPVLWSIVEEQHNVKSNIM